MIVGCIDKNSKFCVLDILYSNIDECKVSVPYIFAYKTDLSEIMYCRYTSEFVNQVNDLVNNRSCIDICCYDLTRLYKILSSYDFAFEHLVSKEGKVLFFKIGTLSFKSISALVCNLSQSKFTGEKQKKTGIILPDTSLTASGVNWVRKYLDNVITIEFEFISFIYNVYKYIPTTRSAIIKQDLAISCFGESYSDLRLDKRKGNKSAFKKYNDYVNSNLGFKSHRNEILNSSHYDFIRRVYRGGFVSYNEKYRGKVLSRVGHKDFCSCYPAAMYMNKFPKRRIGTYYNVDNWASMLENDNVWAMCQIVVRNIRSKHVCHPLSKYTYYTDKSLNFDYPTDSSLVKWDEEGSGSGLVWADFATLYVTYNEFKYLLQFYDIDSCEFIIIDLYETDWLPVEYMNVIMGLFRNKCNLKGSPKFWAEIFAKVGLNSCWGFTTSGFYGDLDTDISNYNNFNSNFADRTWSYFWGVAVTSYARCNLYYAILMCGENWLYSDTDSVFYIKSDDVENRLSQYNDMLRQKMMSSKFSEIYPIIYNSEYVEKSYELGQLDSEDDLIYFLIYNRKCYLGHTGSEFQSATSGVADLDLESYCSDVFHNNVDEMFKNMDKTEFKTPIKYGKQVYVLEHKTRKIKVKDLTRNEYDVDIPCGYYIIERAYNELNEYLPL